MSSYALTWTATVAICRKFVPLAERSMRKPLSLLELSVHCKLRWVEPCRLAVGLMRRLLGAAGAGTLPKVNWSAGDAAEMPYPKMGLLTLLLGLLGSVALIPDCTRTSTVPDPVGTTAES